MTKEQQQEVLQKLREIRNDAMNLQNRIQQLANFVQVNTSNTTETEISQNDKFTEIVNEHLEGAKKEGLI